MKCVHNKYPANWNPFTGSTLTPFCSTINATPMNWCVLLGFLIFISAGITSKREGHRKLSKQISPGTTFTSLLRWWKCYLSLQMLQNSHFYCTNDDGWPFFAAPSTDSWVAIIKLSPLRSWVDKKGNWLWPVFELSSINWWWSNQPLILTRRLCLIRMGQLEGAFTLLDTHDTSLGACCASLWLLWFILFISHCFLSRLYFCVKEYHHKSREWTF